MTHVDLDAGAEELGMDAAGHRLGVLLDYMGVVGWVETERVLDTIRTSSAAPYSSRRKVERAPWPSHRYVREGMRTSGSVAILSGVPNLLALGRTTTRTVPTLTVVAVR